MADELAQVNCLDLVDFQRLLNKYRALEDKIVFKLNCDFPTKSFKNPKAASEICHNIEEKLENVRKLRTDLFTRCIDANKAVIEANKNNDARQFEVRTANNTLRFIRNEQSVDQIVITQTENVVQDRCRKEVLLN